MNFDILLICTFQAVVSVPREMVDDTVESPLLEQDAVKESRNRNLSVFGNALKNHLGVLHNDTYPWALSYEEPYGRGVVASRDIQENELIFYDKPLLIGPRVNNYEKIFCIICYKVNIFAVLLNLRRENGKRTQ